VENFLRNVSVIFEVETVFFMLSNGRESGDGVEERKSQQNEG